MTIRIGAEIVAADLHPHALQVLKDFDDVCKLVPISAPDMSLAGIHNLAKKTVGLLLASEVFFWLPPDSPNWPNLTDYVSLEREVLNHVKKELAELG